MDVDADTHPFRVLLAEDDPVSRAFLTEALRGCGAEVVACVDGTAALGLARSGRWDLLLLDQHLPGLSGAAVLAALGANAAPGGPPALAITAARDAACQDLLTAGFIEVLPKPISLADLRRALVRHGCPTCPALDDAAAFRACGSADIVARLRRLLADEELPAILAGVDGCGGDPERLRPLLHRLHAACGFCGTSALAAAGDTLHAALPHGSREEVDRAMAAFRRAVVATRTALHATLDGSD